MKLVSIFVLFFHSSEIYGAILNSSEYKPRSVCIHGTIIPDGMNCLQYYVCYDGKFVSHRCARIPIQLYFDSSSNSCKSEKEATCFQSNDNS